MDLTVTFRAAHGDVTFGDTKEGGLCALRVPEAIKGSRGGLNSNAYGAVHEAVSRSLGAARAVGRLLGRADRPGGQAPHGRGRGAIFDHPRNPHYPTHWHMRGYGLFAPNAFGLADFDSGYRRCGDWTLAAGERATFRYRVPWHAGDTAEAKVGERYLGWAAPPVVTVAG